ncbi:MAG TPA: preprotein translocase subunit YajC, partial [Aggregatilineales bacterium]|nr:preprotein translocase subunit YajC [Aggregatilineales bacterium]
MPEFALLTFVMLLGLGAWWSMVTFPKQRDFVKRQKFARALAEGDEVITYGGIIGKVIHVDAESGISTVEIAEGVQVRMLN